MIEARSGAALLFGVGVMIATALDFVPGRTPPKVGADWMLSGDFHVHAFPGDGALLPWMVRREAWHAGIDVFAITNHNQTFTARFAQWLATASNGPLVIVGSEITHPRYHLVAVGIDRPVEWNQPAAGAIEAVHAQGGVAIAAHPARRYWPGWDDRAVALLDGVEAAHPQRRVDPDAALDFDAFYNRVRRRKSNVAAIGSSDFHASPSLAECCTYLFTSERTRSGVLDAIRRGRTVAEDAEGRLYGDPELVRAVQANRPRGRSDEQPAWRRGAIVVAWAGLVGMLVLPGGTRD